MTSPPARLILGIPNPVWVWIVVGAATVFLLRRTVFGRAVYAIGNREVAAYLSASAPSAWSWRSSPCPARSPPSPVRCSPVIRPRPIRAWAIPILLPSIAAVVLGGTSILGGRGTYLGTVAGRHPDHPAAVDSLGRADPEAYRQLIFGAVIVAMLLLRPHPKARS